MLAVTKHLAMTEPNVRINIQWIALEKIIICAKVKWTTMAASNQIHACGMTLATIAHSTALLLATMLLNIRAVLLTPMVAGKMLAVTKHLAMTEPNVRINIQWIAPEKTFICAKAKSTTMAASNQIHACGMTLAAIALFSALLLATILLNIRAVLLTPMVAGKMLAVIMRPPPLLILHQDVLSTVLLAP
jgi:hypothetical protein